MKSSVRRTLNRAAGLFLVVVSLVLLGTAAAQDLDSLLIMQEENHPRAYFFRVSEGLASNPNAGYDQWERSMSRLMGIEGKVLNEEKDYSEAPNAEFFTRFKKQHPRQMVLLHLNGNARMPGYRREPFFAGHWLYYEGARILSAVPAEEGRTTLRVSDASLFETDLGRYGNSNDDIGLCVLKEDGKPDWHRSEQVKLVKRNLEKDTITVKRGMYGTQPRSFEGGAAYAAAHCVEGPWGKKDSDLMWAYNYSTTCPEDSRGRKASDVFAAQLGELFSDDGTLAAFDGLEFDVLFNHPTYMIHQRGRVPDCDGDGEGDRGYLDGKNVYGIGVIHFLRKVREELGEDRLIMADGHLSDHQRGFHILNGIESEGWPTHSDIRAREWSGGMNRHLFWQSRGHEPAISYVNHKYRQQRSVVPDSYDRLVFAAATCMNTAICYSSPPRRDPDGMFGVWDELRMGAERRAGWLGEPEGEYVRMAERQPDLLKSTGSPLGERLVDRVESSEASVSLDDRALEARAAESDVESYSFTLQDVPTDGPDLYVSVKARAARREGYPPEMARIMRLQLQGAPRRRTGMRIRGGEEVPIRDDTGGMASYRGEVEMGGESHEALKAHPPWKKGEVGYVFWEESARVPEDGMLRFYTGMGEKSPERSDGVAFIVRVAPVEDGRAGRYYQVHRHVQKSHRWREHRVSLQRWAGRRVRLKFISDCGPDDDTTTDHSFWGDAAVLNADGEVVKKLSGAPPQREYMTWVDETSFTSSFYFTEVSGSRVDLRFTVESEEPVWIEKITVHGHPDALYREFENGVVLANPAPHTYTFDLEELFPGQELRHLQGTETQYPDTNDGSPAGETITIGKKEGMFLIKE